MTYEEILAKLTKRVQEAAKVMKMDDSHSSLRSALQSHLAAQHRSQNPDSGYYDYPQVQDVFGDTDAGQVVHAKGSALTMHDYKKEGAGYSLKNPRDVKRAYASVKEAASLVTKEARESESLVEVAEAFLDKNGKGRIKLIGPCTGSMGHYTVESLKRTAANGTFSKGTKMFLDHQTPEERRARPENSVLNEAAVLDTDAVWEANGKEGPGLYSDVTGYQDKVPFLNAHAKDLGVSVRGMIVPTGSMIDGVPEVKEFARAISVDFVTKAGAGGKPLMEVYESYRREHPASDRQKETYNVPEIKESDLVLLQEAAAAGKQVPALLTRLDRLEADNSRYKVRDIVAPLVQESKLPPRMQDRISKPFLSVAYSAPMKDGKLDVEAITLAVKESIKEETAYLQESGIRLPGVVHSVGGTPATTEDKRTAEQVAQEADNVLRDAARSLSGLSLVQEKGQVA